MAKSLTTMPHGKMAEDGFKKKWNVLENFSTTLSSLKKIALRPFELIWFGSVERPNTFVNRLSYLSDDFIFISVRQRLIVAVRKKHNCLAAKKTPMKNWVEPAPDVSTYCKHAITSPKHQLSQSYSSFILYLYTVLYKGLANRNFT